MRHVLQFPEAVIDDYTVTPTESGPKGVLILRHELTQTMAEEFDCSWAFGANLASGAGIDVTLRDMMVSLPNSAGGYDQHFPEKICRIRVERTPEQERVDLVMRLHCTSKLDEILATVVAKNKDPFEMAIQPRQGDLFEGGRKVDMSGPEEVGEPSVPLRDDPVEDPPDDDDDDEPRGSGCKMCDSGNDVDAEGFHTHKKGRKVIRVKCLKHRSGPALASKREMEDFVQ